MSALAEDGCVIGFASSSFFRSLTSYLSGPVGRVAAALLPTIFFDARPLNYPNDASRLSLRR
jgi:hypothetical protein